MDANVSQVLVTMTQEDDGGLRCRFECVGTGATWGAVALAALVYGEGDEVEDVKFL